MGRRSSAVLVVVAVVLLGGLAALVAADRSDRTTLADGARIAGIDVGGLSAADARRKLDAELTAKLGHPAVVGFQDEVMRLEPEAAGVRADVDGMVANALDRSRGGSLPGRLVDRLSGSSPSVDVELRARADDAAVDRFLADVRRVVDRPARDADVDLAGGDVSITESRDGRRLNAADHLRRAVLANLLTPGAQGPLRADAVPVQAETTTEDLTDRYPMVLVVDRSAFELRVYEDLELVKTYGVAVGKVGLGTPAGRYEVRSKQVDPDWHVPNSDWAGSLAGTVVPGGTPQNPLKARWLGLTTSGVGIHGTDEEDSIGTKASHGCIRMRVADVKRLYERAKVGTPVFIA